MFPYSYDAFPLGFVYVHVVYVMFTCHCLSLNMLSLSLSLCILLMNKTFAYIWFLNLQKTCLALNAPPRTPTLVHVFLIFEMTEHYKLSSDIGKYYSGTFDFCKYW